ncbi:MAG: hypothetical protein KDA94_06815, partial [Acidimicrobiales bacterium]|nr:hypothetical protein [Acidimicrobiales bacterium]
MPLNPEPSLPPADPVLRIDCDECALQGTPTCGDCVVTFLLGEPSSVVVDLAEVRAVRLLAEGGLAPPLRHVRST